MKQKNFIFDRKVKTVNTITNSTTWNAALLVSMPQHQCAYVGKTAIKPVFTRVYGVAVAKSEENSLK